MLKDAMLTLIPLFFRYRGGGGRITTAAQPSDEANQKQMNREIITWCIVNEFLLQTTTGSYQPNITTMETMASRFCQHIFAMNLKRLCVSSCLNELLTLMCDTDYDKTTSRLIDLHIHLVTELDTRFLNNYTNKLYHVLSTVCPDTDTDTTWQELFQTYPYLWLLFPIQHVLRSTTIDMS